MFHAERSTHSLHHSSTVPEPQVRPAPRLQPTSPPPRVPHEAHVVQARYDYESLAADDHGHACLARYSPTSHPQVDQRSALRWPNSAPSVTCGGISSRVFMGISQSFSRFMTRPDTAARVRGGFKPCHGSSRVESGRVGRDCQVMTRPTGRIGRG